jgi:Tfp pilus assembly protein PilF
VLRFDTGSGYQNIRAGVKYVGDDACVKCHGEILASFRQTPMGSSLGPIANGSAITDSASGDQRHFKAQGLDYLVENRGGRIFHVESREDSSGADIARNEAEVQYVLGSGRQAFAFLIERDGFLFESPITWYARERKWQLSPGYERRNYHFDRPILEDCLFCHTNRVERVSRALNQYQTPIFHGYGIGCERCHGPGELHIQRSQVIDGLDLTIVNPANLRSSLSDAICEQCHLIGRRVNRPESKSEDFRPGLPFYQFWSALVPADESGGNRFASQAEQMHDSRCFRASDGRLRCISCHDPHATPAVGEKVFYFRDRCLECHSDRGCSQPVQERLKLKLADDCIGCHMPQSHSSNNIHVATTDHRIPRKVSEKPTLDPTGDPASRRAAMLVNFHRGLMTGKERTASERDRAIALCREGRGGASAALPLLEAALAARPHDLPAWEAKGEALGLLDRPAEGMAAYQMALAEDPNRETALGGAASLATRSGHLAAAAALWQRAIAINPWRSDYHAELALAQMNLRKWNAAAAACKEVLRLNPSFVEVRKWLVRSYLHLGNTEAARKELQIVLGFDPPDRDALLEWFEAPSRVP